MTQDNTLQTIEALIERTSTESFKVLRMEYIEGSRDVAKGCEHLENLAIHINKQRNALKSLYESAQEMAEALFVAYKATDPFALTRENNLKIQEALSNFNAMKEKQK